MFKSAALAWILKFSLTNATYKPNNNFELTFYAHNITDEGYITDILESGVVTGQTVPQGILGPPKTYGMKMSINF